MEKFVLGGLEIQFSDLSEEAQKRFYLQDKERFKDDAAKSQYANIRELIVNDEESDSATLDEVFKTETEIYGNFQNLKLLWEHRNFQKDDKKCKVLAESNNWKYRKLAAEDEGSTSEFLNQMLRNEIDGDIDSDVIEAILNNPNFQMENETRKVLAESNDWEYRKLAVVDEGSSRELLEDIYLKETDEDVLEVIELNLLKKISKTSVTLNVVQERKILEVLKALKRSTKRIPLSKYLNQILEIIG